MRQLRFSLFAALCAGMLMWGCSKESVSKGSDVFELHQTGVEGLYRADFNGTTSALMDTILEAAMADYESVVTLRNPNKAASGHYLTQQGHTVTFSAMENNGGVHGAGRVTGPFFIELRWRTACIEVVGNRATVAGELTYVELGDNPNNYPFSEGWLFYIAVEDNGEGANARPDRYNRQLYYGMPGFGEFCNILRPDIPLFWPNELWFEVVGEGDQIQVK